MSFKVHSCLWKQQLTKQSHLSVHLIAVLELSIVSHDLYKQIIIFSNRYGNVDVRFPLFLSTFSDIFSTDQ